MTRNLGIGVCRQIVHVSYVCNKSLSRNICSYVSRQLFMCPLSPKKPKMDGWMDDLRFYVLFNSISVISGRCIDDNERLCAMELRLRLRRFHLE